MKHLTKNELITIIETQKEYMDFVDDIVEALRAQLEVLQGKIENMEDTISRYESISGYQRELLQ